MRLTWVVCLVLLLLSSAVASARRAGPSQLMLHKVSSVLVSQWETTRDGRRDTIWVECFLRITGEATVAVRQSLADAGAVVRSVIPEHRGRQRPATLLTAQIRLADLPSVAALHFVETIEGAARVGLKPHVRVKTTK